MRASLYIPLGLCAAAGLTFPVQAQESYMADLSGAAEVPGPGDPDAAGIATIDWNIEVEQLCYALSIDDMDPASAAHIHRGAAGEAGPPVVTLETPGPDGGANGCMDIDDGLRAELRDNPGSFYINVHNDAYPAGAVRGQLER